MTQVKLGEYKGMEIPKIIVEVSAEEITAELERARQMAAEMIEVEQAADGDTVTIDFEGFLDGVSFEGGKGESYPLTLGSGSFIPGFEEQLIDAKKGDDVEVVVTFPENYQAEELAGKETVFKVKVHNVTRQEVPEMGDGFVSKVTPFSTLDEFRAAVEKEMTRQKMRQEKQEAAKKQLMAACEVILEAEELEKVTEEFVDNMRQQMQAYGMTLEDYLQMAGSSMETVRAENKIKAEEMLKCAKILEEIAKEENIEATEAEIKREIEGLARQYQMPLEQIEGMLRPEDKANIAVDIKLGKAFEYVMDSCVEV
ncbi:MAG: trigger factor [Lachnospira sp.]|nr:trigger factor [Lachnospira sp.]